MEGVSIPLAVGGAQAGASAYGAYAQNQQVGRSMRSARDAAVLRSGQLGEVADLERRKRDNEAHQIRSRLRVLSAESGLGSGGSFEDLRRQADIDSEINRAIIDRNLYNQRLSLFSGLNASLRSMQAGAVNPALTTIQGGLSGYSTGLQIEDALRTINPPKETRRLPGHIPPPYNPYEVGVGT